MITSGLCFITRVESLIFTLGMEPGYTESVYPGKMRIPSIPLLASKKGIMDISKLEHTLRSMESSEFDKILNMRDGQMFDAAWCQVFKVVDEFKIEFDNESIFKKISEATSHHEITSYIVEDFELLAKSQGMGINPKFVIYMRECYEQGNVPHVW
ncbi:MAG: hypothetical protein ACI9Y1_003262 [Lentisphaeria bacterium]|jgi:hypothetical protein